MRPFGVVDPHENGPHAPGTACAACPEGYPQPCPRVVTRRWHRQLDDAGQVVTQGWEEIRCPGHLHAELGPGPAIEQRCEACGVPA
jgi:hypothetical protein